MANQGLGRGLGSLIPNKNKARAETRNDSPAAGDRGVNEVDVSLIKTNPLQPRQKFTDTRLEELEESIREYGIIQPLVVSYNNGEYELIAGERRLRAAKKAGLKTVPVVIRKAKDKEKLELSLIENIQREDLNPIELARAYKRLEKEFNLTHEKIAKQVGKARSSVTNIIRMLGLPEEIQLALIDGRIHEGHAKYLMGLDTESKQMKLFRKIIHGKLSVQETDKESRVMGGTKAARIKINYADKEKEFVFREFFSARAEIKRKGRGGQIIINFSSDDELEEMTKKIRIY